MDKKPSGFPNTFIRPSSFAGFTLWLTANSSLVLTALAPRVTMRRTCLYLAGRLLTDKTAMLTSNLSGVCFLLWKWNIMRFRRNDADSTCGCFLSGWSYQLYYHLWCNPLPCVAALLNFSLDSQWLPCFQKMKRKKQYFAPTRPPWEAIMFGENHPIGTMIGTMVLPSQLSKPNNLGPTSKTSSVTRPPEIVTWCRDTG